jgi:hypothetical protein
MKCVESRNRARILLVAALALACGFGLTGTSEAQGLYGTIVGNITDSTGAAVPGATVTITHLDTNLSREVTANAEGAYRFPSVQSGSYSIKVALTGFKEFIKENVPVTPNTVSRVDIGLEVGQLAEAVTVQSERALLQTDKGDIHSELSGKEVTALPTGAYRNYQMLINLVPGATPARFQNATADTPARSMTTNVNGANRNSNSTRLDGTANVFIWLPHHAAYVAPAETVETVNVTTNSFDAELGNAGGAAVSVVTKSGTNEFRGSLFALHEDERFRARNFFQTTGDKPKSSRNIDGATLGGPIIKDKLFFFAGWEGTFERGAKFRTGTVPTMAMRSGNFSGLPVTLYDPRTGNPDGSGRTPFPGNIIPANRLDPIAQNMISRIPAPTAGGTSANFSRTANQTLDRHNYDFKVNFNRSASHQIWAKYSQMNADFTCEFFLQDAGGPCLGDGGSGKASVDVFLFSAGHTWTLGANWVLESNFGFTDHNQEVKGPDYGQNFGLDVLGIPGTNGSDPRQGGMPIFNFNNYEDLGNTENWSPIFRDERVYTFNTSLTHIRDKHEIKVGFDLVRMELDHWQPEIGAGPRGRFNYFGGATALRGGAAPNQFNEFADFLLGLNTSVEKSLQYEEMTGREWQVALYVRDRWQVRRNLTISAGLRFEHYPLMTRKDRGLELYDFNTNMILLGGKGGNPEDLGIKVQYPRFTPRLGIAWRVNDTNVVRAGYGMTVDPMPFARPLRGFYPLTIAQDFVGASQFQPYNTLAQGIPAFTGPPLDSGVVPIPGTVQMRTMYPDHVNRTYIQSWNLTYERKLPWDIAGSISYVGTQTTNQLADIEANAAEVGQGNAGRPLARQFGRTASTLLWDGWLSSNYHGLQIALNRPFSKGIFVKAAYTWSRAMNWTDDQGWAGLFFNAKSELDRNYAQAGYNIPHIAQFAVMADLPFARNSNGFLAQIVKNWQVNAIASGYSGRPFAITSSGASLNAPGSNQTPDQVAPVRHLGGIGANEPFYDPASFRPVTEVRFGTVGRNYLRGPATYNLDLSLFRRFPIKDRVSLEFRAEAFNVTNTPHFALPNGNANSTAFMTITSTDGLLAGGGSSDQRQVRFGLRLGF